MSSSLKKKLAQRPSMTKSNNSHLTQSITQKKEGAESKPVKFTMREKSALFAVSRYNSILKAPNFFLEPKNLIQSI